MARPTFERGVEDVRAGRDFPPDYDLWSDTNSRWSYERGRQWARLVPRHVRLKVGGKLTGEALRLFRWHWNDIL